MTGGLRERAIIEETTSTLRHDVRNKLATLRSAVFFLKKRVSGTALWEEERRVSTFFQLMESEIAAAEAVLSERTSAGCLPAQSRGLHRLADVVAEVLPEFPVDRIERELSGATEMEMDRAEVRLLVEALVENALEATKDGMVLVETMDTADGGCVLWVRDTGAGFATAISGRAVEPFVSSRPGRAGLGLAIARRLAGRNGGTIKPPRAGESTVEVRFARAAGGR